MCYDTEMNENGKTDGMESKKKKKSKKFDKIVNLSLLQENEHDDEIDSLALNDSFESITPKEGKSRKKKKHLDKTLLNSLQSEKQESGKCNGVDKNRQGNSLTSGAFNISTTCSTDSLHLTGIKEKTDSASQEKLNFQSETPECRKKKKKDKDKSEKVQQVTSSSSAQKTSNSAAKSLSSSSSSILSSSKIDFDFFKGILSRIPVSALASYQIPESDSDEEDEMKDNSGRKRKKKDRGKKADKKQRLNVPNEQSSQTGPQDSQQEEPYSKVKEKQKHKNKNKNKNKKTNLVKETELAKATDRRQLLQQKLEARIQELRAKRKLSPEELLERKRLKRKESKMKLKIRRKKEKLSKSSINTDSTNENKDEDTVTIAISNKPSLVDKGGKLVFSKFDFTESGKSEKKKKSKSGLVGKDYKRLLEKIEKRNEKINSLKETDAEKAKKVEEKTVWKTAMLKAEGERVKDDVQLLKKSLKAKEKQKSKRKKKWKERESQVKKRQEQRQEKRQKHIKERKQAVKDKKIKKAKKKGRLLPGF